MTPAKPSVPREADAVHMRRALELAARGRGMTSPNPMVGAVIAAGDKVAGEGWHRAAGLPHAEADALEAAKKPTRGATLYVTLEPCCHEGKTPPCTRAIIAAGITRVVAAMLDPNPQVAGKGVAELRAAGISVEVGLLETEARVLNEAFLCHHLLHRPFIISKWAMTLDGRIATQSGHSRWISNEQSREYVHRIRSEVDAVMVGIGTVLTDNPALNVRLPDYAGRQPKRIVVDGILRIPLKARVFENSEPGQVIIATTESLHRDKIGKLRDAGHEILVFPGRRGIVDLRQFIRKVSELGVHSILCEGGSTLNGSLFHAHLVDKVVAFVAPKLCGGNEMKCPTAGWGVQYMTQALVLDEPVARPFGTDICFEGYVPGPHRQIAAPVGEQLEPAPICPA
jgi:diaminohydroxyphosphoribosylaminopyrimidine deaminase / 5-amino-6-(5-phosphoribosylamino)uracil reductase